jgi:uncharacterized protein YceH (UPF0502 family)
VNILLTVVETRILGCLIEKEVTTPDYYPLSINSLMNACNQKSSRDPVMELDEDAVRQGLHGLQDKGLVRASLDSRVSKYEHLFQEKLNLGRREIAILCLLFLRGPQTPGELRGRTERLYRFDELTDVQSTLQRLMEHDPPLVKVLPRQPGTKELRYAHLLSGDVEGFEVPVAAVWTPAADEAAQNATRIAALEQQVADLQQELGELKRQFAELREQPQ